MWGNKVLVATLCPTEESLAPFDTLKLQRANHSDSFAAEFGHSPISRISPPCFLRVLCQQRISRNCDQPPYRLASRILKIDGSKNDLIFVAQPLWVHQHGDVYQGKAMIRHSHTIKRYVEEWVSLDSSFNPIRQRYNRFSLTYRGKPIHVTGQYSS